MNDELLSRLSQLNRKRLPSHTSQGSGFADCAVRSDVGLPQEGDEDLSQLPSGSEIENVWGSHWQRERPIDEVWPQGGQWIQQRIERVRHIGNNGKNIKRELRALTRALPERVIYLDLETCGFAGSMVFLIGLVYYQNGRFVLSQLLARNYAEEKAMLQSLWHKTAGRRVLATFNGKSFDWPMVHDRSTLHHLGRDMRDSASSNEKSTEGDSSEGGEPVPVLNREDPRPELIHCDLLHHARRRWKDEFPNCKLQTLETRICRRKRTQDIPGREIPAAYHDFVRSGDGWLIRSVLHHNALDLITLLQLSFCVV